MQLDEVREYLRGTIAHIYEPTDPESLRAGEAITEIGLAMQNEINLKELASTVHPYPTYNSGIQMLATQMVLETAFFGMRGSVLQMLAQRSW